MAWLSRNSLASNSATTTFVFLVVFSLITFVYQFAHALIHVPEEVGYNLNENVTAVDPLVYWGEWQSHTFNGSPVSWRLPFYTIFLDKSVNGNPRNDDANGTMFEHDVMGNQLRHGGDVKGLMNSLDYLQGMGIKVCVVNSESFALVADTLSP